MSAFGTEIYFQSFFGPVWENSWVP